MAEEQFLKSVANSKTIPQLPESLGIQADDYVVVYSTNLQKPVKVKKSNVQFPTSSFVRGETVVDFPNSGALDSLYLENSTNKLYKWDGSAYKDLLEDELTTINNYIATKLDKGEYVGDAVSLLSEAKAYTDSLINGVKWKDAVDLATTANITLSGEQTIDGIATSASRVLVKDQTDKTQNGIYTTSSTGWVRTADADTGEELVAATAKVLQGTANQNVEFTCNNAAITLGTTEITFVSRGSAEDHNSTTGKQGGTTNEYYHLSLADYNKVGSLPATSEDQANKAATFAVIDDVKYPTTKAVADRINEFDDVKGYVNKTGFPATGEVDVLYIDKDEKILYVWDSATSAYAKASGGVVEDAIADGVVNKAPSQNAVFDALAGKANDSEVVRLSEDTHWASGFMLHNVANDYSDLASKINDFGANPVMGFVHRVDGERRFVVLQDGNGYSNFNGVAIRARHLSSPFGNADSLSDTTNYATNLTFEENIIINRGFGDDTFEVYSFPSHDLAGTTDKAAYFWIKRHNVSPNAESIENALGYTPANDSDVQGKAATGTELDISRVAGTSYNYGGASTATEYTFINPKINGYAKGLINAASEPKVVVSFGAAEVASLQITAAPTTVGNVTVTLDGASTNIAVDPAVETTAVAVADKIRATAFSGWTTGGTTGTDTVTFTANTVGAKTDATYADGGTGATGTMTTTTQGVDNTYAPKIKGATFAANTNMEMVVESVDGTNVRYFFLEL